jgi:mono/diheme cytochrome c family protein
MRSRLAPTALLLAAASSVLLAAACLGAPREPPSPALGFARDPAALERGRKLFVGSCAGYCHVAGGQGLGNAPDLLDCEWRHGGSDAAIFAVLRAGVPGTPMLGFAGKLPDDDLWRVIAYLRSASRCSAP